MQNPTVFRLNLRGDCELIIFLGQSLAAFLDDAADLMTEVSTGANDQAQRMAQILSTLDGPERAVLVDVVERLATCLNRR